MNNQPSFNKKRIIENYAFLTLLLFFSGIFFSTAFAQDVIVSGTVNSAEDGLPLPGVSIVDVNDATVGVISDFDGNYSIALSSGTTSLRFSSIGSKTVVIPVNNQTTLNVTLEEDVASLDEVVVVGYGTQKKATVTGAVTAIQGPVLETSPTISVSNSLAGRLPGVVIIQTSGEPGNDEATIRIRGTNT